MKVYALVAALGISGAAQAQDPLPPTRRGDFGVRYWVSTGEVKRSHNAQGFIPSLGNPTSVLVYENLDANVFELFGRQNFANRLYLKGTVGGGRVTRGMFDDKDFDAGQVLTDHTTSSVSEGRIGYGTIDLGHQWVLREGAVTFGVFAGFSQWTEEVEASGTTVHAGSQVPASPDTRVITNETRWRALRVGLDAEVRFGGRTRLSVDLAVNPYAKVREQDSHHLRPDLGPVPNIQLEGEGWGVQWDAELRYEIRRRTELGLGVRYWHMEIDTGTRALPNVIFPKLPLTELYSTRFGAMLSLRRVW